MKERILIVVLALVAFVSGFGTRLWTEGERTALPAPPHLGGEFARPGVAAADAKEEPKKQGRNSKDDRARALAEIERFDAYIKTYQKTLAEMDAEFERNLITLLTPEQRERFTARQKRVADGVARKAARITGDTTVLTDEQFFRYQREPLFNVLLSCSITARMNNLASEIKLEPGQIPEVRKLYEARLQKFLKLVDSTPPPSIALSDIASAPSRLGVDPAKLEQIKADWASMMQPTKAEAAKSEPPKK